MSAPYHSPRHWPPEVQYIRSQSYHSSVSLSLRLFISGTSSFPSRTSGRSIHQRPPVTIQRIFTASHPALGQHGLFTSRKILPRMHIIDYVGEVHCDDRPGSDYDISLYRSQDGVNIGIDALVMGNEARFINDYRGVRDKPNALFVDSRNLSGELRMSIWSGGDVIKKGDEILVSYGKSWWRARTSE